MLTLRKPEGKEGQAQRLATTLHEEQDGKSAITLTTCMVEPLEKSMASVMPASSKSNCSVKADKAPVNSFQLDSEHITDDVEFSFDYIDSRHTTKKLEKLEMELDEHFERLRGEYEHKRGIKWTPLRPSNYELWVWEEDETDIDSLAESPSSVDESTTSTKIFSDTGDRGRNYV